MLGVVVWLVARPWPVEASLKTASHAGTISLAGGLELAGVSASAAAILDGPGVVVVLWRGRERWRRSIARVSPEAFFDWLAAREPAEPPGSIGRLVTRVKDALLARTDTVELPRLGVRVLLGLRDPSVHGALNCGFADPALTGKTAAWLFPIAGVLAPLGSFDVSLDWSGRTVLDGTFETSFRVVPARVILECLRFASRHVHVRRKNVTVSSTLAAQGTT